MFSGCPSVAVHTAAALCTFEPPTLWYTFYDCGLLCTSRNFTPVLGVEYLRNGKG